MQCPLCNVPLQMTVRKDVEIDYCLIVASWTRSSSAAMPSWHHLRWPSGHAGMTSAMASNTSVVLIRPRSMIGSNTRSIRKSANRFSAICSTLTES